MTILFFGIYNPEYSRTRLLMRGLQESGVTVLQCNDRSPSVQKYFKLIFKYIFFNKPFDIIFVAFPGQETMFLISLLTLPRRIFKRTPIIFDTLTSHYEGHILDRKKYPIHSLRASWYRFLDKYSVLLADLSLLEANAHVNFFIREYNLPPKKLTRLFQGSDDKFFYPKKISNEKFTVYFHGNFIPVQGVEYIIRAAHILREEPLVFHLLGKGQDYQRCRNLAEELQLKNIIWFDRVLYEELPSMINEGDICLGTFGDSVKAHTSISNKIFEYMACGKAIITAKAESLEEVIHDGINGIFCKMADPEDLARVIKKLKDEPELRESLGRHARQDFEASYTPKHIAQELLDKLKILNLIAFL
jgi:glycosyltransferase involved in cell wall biosynthesis